MTPCFASVASGSGELIPVAGAVVFVINLFLLFYLEQSLIIPQNIKTVCKNDHMTWCRLSSVNKALDF
jgi:hypothetical protein